MANTTNFGWETPDDTDLVKDGAAAMRTLGNSIDSSFVDLKGGTTGQVLSKASNTDLDYTWVTTDDANAIQNSIIDAKGDLIAGSSADTPAILSAGSNGSTLVADSAATTGLRWQGNYSAGKNKIINGDFSIWQRGTSFTAVGYNADRWTFSTSVLPTSWSISRQTFTPGTAPVAGYESQYFWRYAITTVGSSTDFYFSNRIEDVRTFAGQTVTYSFWAKADSARTILMEPYQDFGSGGSSSVTVASNSHTLTTSWARYTGTITVPSISGKTIGTSSFLAFMFKASSALANGYTLDLWGMQVEAGSVATAFQTATGTIQGELAACQRYYYRITNSAGERLANNGYAGTTSTVRLLNAFPVTMRTKPTALEQSGTAGDYGIAYAATGIVCTSVPTFLNASTNHAASTFTVSTTPFTVGSGAEGYAQNATGYLGWSAEL